MLLVYKADHPALICKVLKKKEQKRARGRLFRTIIKVFNKSHVRRLKDTFHSMASTVTIYEVSKKHTISTH